MSNFQPKTMGDCEIVSSKNDKLFEDDIVIVVSDAYREKKREERRKKKEAAALSSNSDPNLPSTSSASSSSSASTATLPAPSGRPVPTFYPDLSSTPAPASTSTRTSTSALSTAPSTAPSTVPSTAPSTASVSQPSSSRNLGLTVSSVLTAVTGALATIASPLTSSTGTSTSSSTSSVGVGTVNNNNILNSEEELWIRFRHYDRRKEYMCPCTRCRGRSWYLTFETVRRHCHLDGYISGWVPANSPAASNSPFGMLAIAAGGQANTPGVRPPPAPVRPAAPPPARPVPVRPVAVRAPPPNTGPVITDDRPAGAGNQQRNAQQNRLPYQAAHQASYQARILTGRVPAPPFPPPSGPSLDNLPETVPNVVETDPNPLTCPVCLDSKAQIQASSRNLVSTKCGHVFCSFCIEQVFKSTRQCPQCRKKLTNKCWHPLYI
ncbi:hypothetical protein ACHWQZ_G007689 [Mnemiopsis leidyi]